MQCDTCIEVIDGANSNISRKINAYVNYPYYHYLTLGSQHVPVKVIPKEFCVVIISHSYVFKEREVDVLVKSKWHTVVLNM